MTESDSVRYLTCSNCGGTAQMASRGHSAFCTLCLHVLPVYDDSPEPTQPVHAEQQLQDQLAFRQLLDALNLSTRAENGLLRSSIRRADQLRSLTSEKLLRLTNVGRKTADEIIEALKGHPETAIPASAGPKTEMGPAISETSSPSVSDFIDLLHLSVRAENALRGSGPGTIAGLATLSRRDVLSMKNVGMKTADEILTALEKLPLRAELLQAEDSPDLEVEPVEVSADKTTLPCAPSTSSLIDGDVPEALLDMTLEQIGLPSVFVRRTGWRSILTIRDLLSSTIADARVLDPLGIAWCELQRLLATWGLVCDFSSLTDAGVLRVPTSLDDELDIMAALAGKPAQAAAVARYFGWDGGAPSTLREAGEAHGWSRERVRQLVARVESKVRLHRWANLSSALEKIAECAPCPAQVAELELLRSGCCRRPISIAGVLGAAEIAGVSAPVTLLGGEVQNVVRTGSEALPDRIRRFVGKSTNNHGAVCMSEVLEWIRSEQMPISPTEVRTVLEMISGFGWLDAEREWFWVHQQRETHNRLLNLIDKVLCVAGSIHLDELYAQLKRHRELQVELAPPGVIREVCRQRTDCLVVDGDVVRSLKPLDSRQILSGPEQLYFGYFSEGRGVASRAEIEELFQRAGMGTPSVTLILQYSPIAKRFLQNAYGLAGQLPGVPIDSTTAASPTQDTATAFNWTVSGSVRATLRVNRTLRSNGLFSVPKGFVRFLEGEYRLVDSNGDETGRVKVDAEGRGWGIGPAVRRLPASVTEIALEFDPASREVSLRLGRA